jgi:hypothetical protein
MSLYARGRPLPVCLPLMSNLKRGCARRLGVKAGAGVILIGSVIGARAEVY